MSRRFAASAAAILAVVVASGGAKADDETLDRKIRDLARRMETLQSEMNQLRIKNQTLQDQQTRQAGQLQEAQTRQVAVPAVGTVVTAGDVPRSIKIPGTDVSLRFGGYAKLDIIDDVAGGGMGGTAAVYPSIPFKGSPQSRREGQWSLTGRQSRLNVDASMPTDWGLARAFVEGDFYGAGGNEVASNSAGFRLRHAYAQLGPVIAGQTWSTMLDLPSVPETIDFTGPAGYAASMRQAQLRYTTKLGPGDVAVAIENPEGDFFQASQQTYVAGTSLVSTNFLDKAPDIVGKYTVGGSWGSLAVSGVGRYLTLNNKGQAAIGGVVGETSTFAGGASVGAAINTVGKDVMTVSLAGGPGFGRYLFQAPANDAAYIKNGSLTAQWSWGATASYRHYWTDTLRSNLVWGHVQVDNPHPYLPSTAIDRIDTAMVNLIWTPLKNTTVGAQYMYGYLKSGARQSATVADYGSASRLHFSVQYDF